jgi:hypothetical protein
MLGATILTAIATVVLAVGAIAARSTALTRSAGGEPAATAIDERHVRP